MSCLPIRRGVPRALLGSLLVLVVVPEALADTKAEARRYFTRGMVLIEQEQYPRGIALLKKAYAVRPHPSVLFNMGRAYAAMGALEDAIRHLEGYVDADPPDVEEVRSTIEALRKRHKLRLMVDEGMNAIRSRKFLEGAALLERAYAVRPHANILYNMARAYEEAGQLRRALKRYRRYLKASPKDTKEVRGRILSLKKTLKKRDTPKTRVASGRPKRSGSVSRDEPQRSEPSILLDDTWVARIAEAMVERLKTEGVVSGPEPLATLKEPSDRKKRPLSGEGGLDEGSEVPPGLQPPVKAPKGLTSTDLSMAPVAVGLGLGAKTSEAYEEVVVTASRRAQSPLDAPNAVTILTDEDIRLSGVQSIPDLLRRVPGMDVMAMSYSDHNVSMRGFNRRIANKILVLIDGRTAYRDFLGVVTWHALTIDLMDIDRIEVVRGPGSAIYGAYAYTGIVNIITKRPDQIGGSVGRIQGGNGKSLSASYQYGKRSGPLGVRASVGYTRGDKFELEFDPARVDYTTDSKNPNRSIEHIRADVTTEYDLRSDGGVLFLGGGLRSGTVELYGVAALRNQETDGRDFNLRGGYRGKLFSLLGFWNVVRSDSTPQFFRTGLDDLGSTVHADLVGVEAVLTPEFRLLGEHALTMGAQYRFKFINWDYLDDTHSEDHIAVFFQDSWVLSKSWSVIASGRLDLHPIIGPLASPRVALIYKPTPVQAIRLSFGTAFREPTLAETYLDLSASTDVASVAVTLKGGQEDLEPENIVTVDLGYRLQTEFGEFEAVGYMNRISNLITRSPLRIAGTEEPFREQTRNFVGAVSLYENESRKFLALGSELSTRLYPLDGIDLGASYAFQYIFDASTGDRFTDSPLHKVTLWGQLRTELGIDASLSFHYVSSQNWVEPSFDPNDPSGFNTDPLLVDDSLVIIGRIAYRLFEDRLELALSGTNLLDFGEHRHREHPFANHVEARVTGSMTARF